MELRPAQGESVAATRETGAPVDDSVNQLGIAAAGVRLCYLPRMEMS